MKRIFLSLLLLFPLLAAAQNNDSGWGLSWHGFVNPHAWFDSRQVVAGREDMMLFFPKPVDKGADGNDLNATQALQMMSITARLNLTIKGPDVLGASVKGFIEGDFTGSTNGGINDLRLRHAYIDMDWGGSKLLMGQYWYAMVIHEVMPGTNPLNMGAPFHPYARYSQMRYSYRAGQMEAVAVAQFQLDNKSTGPDQTVAIGGNAVASTAFASRSLVPETNLQLRYRGQRLFLGAAVNLLVIKPRDYTYDSDGNKRTTSRLFPRYSYSFFGRYDWDHWTLKAQTLLNDNLYEGCTLGGYIETPYTKMLNEVDIFGVNKTVLYYDYRDWTFTTVWADFGKTTGRWRPGIFVGYAHNNEWGTVLDANSLVFGRGYDIEHLYRIQPRLVFHTQKGLFFQGEAEYTAAKYANGWADNLRLSLGATYAF